MAHFFAEISHLFFNYVFYFRYLWKQENGDAFGNVRISLINYKFSHAAFAYQGGKLIAFKRPMNAHIAVHKHTD